MQKAKGKKEEERDLGAARQLLGVVAPSRTNKRRRTLHWHVVWKLAFDAVCKDYEYVQYLQLYNALWLPFPQCEPNTDDHDLHGAYLTCLRVTGPTLSGLSCLRYKITDASLFRDQSRSNPYYTQRWQSMEMVSITDWASPESKVIELTHDFGKARFPLRVKQFIPVEGD